MVYISAVFISEMSHKSLRNKLGAMPTQLYAMGFLLAYLMGYFSGWRMIAFTCSGISFLSTVLPLFLPETPYWLIQRNKVKEAE